MLFNCIGQIKSLTINNVKQVESIKYLVSLSSCTLGSYSQLLLSICLKNQEMSQEKNFFQATLESVLLYSSTTRTLTKKLENKLDETSTRMP